MTTETRDIIHLAALLHDIGKFWQRADVSYYNSSQLAKYPFVVNNADSICPTSQEGYFKYQHVIWTQLFFEDNLAIFEKLGIYDKSSSDNLVNISIHHHKPKSKLQAFIQLADWWASGIDRTTSEYQEGDKIKRGKLKFKEEPLISIFGNLKVSNTESKVNKTAFRLSKLSLNKIFPTNEKYQAGVSQNEYAELWTEFSEEFKNLPTDSLSVFNTSLHYLLKKYCWCIPASTIDLADNSLFDHLKITGAIAQSLYDYHCENPSAFNYNQKLILQQGHSPLLLLCVDVSGIQKFIYDISSKFASKSLKGRSFSLQLMLDEIANEIISKTSTTLSHIIYSSGGKFFMLLPNTQVVKDALNKLEEDIKNAIWSKFKGNIYVCMGFEEFAFDLNKKSVILGNEHKTLGDLWKKVSEKTAEKKYQKFKNLLLDDYEKFFSNEGIGQGGQKAICSVTGEESDGISKIDDEVKISPQVKEQKVIGQALAKNDFIVLANRADRQPNLLGTGYESLIGRNYWLLTSKDLLPTENAEVCLTVKNEINFIKPQSTSAKNTAYSYRFYGGSESALDKKGESKNFEQLAGIEREDNDKEGSLIVKSECAGLFNRLAILRMDVDGLGQLFIKGFNKETASFSAYATLSGQLDWFFSGYLNTIRSKEVYKDWVNIIYSGGDDVFAVGRWDNIIAFAEEVQQEFKKFTGRNDITISAGISIVTPKFPIAKAADLAGEAEHLAKDFKRSNKKEKDALCLFGIAVGWEEFAIIKDIKDFWIEHLIGESPVLSHGILQKVFDWYEISKQKDRNENLDLSWKWNAAYSLKRYESKDTKRNDALKVIETALLCNQFRKRTIRFDVFALASRWAELILRDKRNLQL